ncbi:MAG: carboxypeptidase-like regulatory domain-containing protein [Bacteroidota bacterium]
MRKLKLLMLAVLLLSVQLLWAQTKTVTGKVTDAKDGTPITGVSVKVKGSNTGTFTANDGSYIINLPKGLNSLVFSTVGFEDQEIEVKGSTVNASLSRQLKT